MWLYFGLLTQVAQWSNLLTLEKWQSSGANPDMLRRPWKMMGVVTGQSIRLYLIKLAMLISL